MVNDTINIRIMFYPCVRPSVGLPYPNGLDNTRLIPKIGKLLVIGKETCNRKLGKFTQYNLKANRGDQ